MGTGQAWADMDEGGTDLSWDVDGIWEMGCSFLRNTDLLW